MNINILYGIFLLLIIAGCSGGEETNSNSSSQQTSTAAQPEQETESVVYELSYNEQAEYLILYTNCIGCHNNQNNMDFSDVDAAITEVETAFSDENIDSASGEDAKVDAAIAALVDLYHAEGNGKPFTRTGNDTEGDNMSDEVSHSEEDKVNIDYFESFVIQENNL